jgi:hypothetical protein
MKKAMNLMAVLFGLAILCAGAQAQMPKSGKASLYYSWHARGQMISLGEGFALNSGSAWGVVINREGSGFLHDTPTSCAAAVKVIAGKAGETGYCASTDADGDRVYMRWNCAYDDKGWCVGDFDWTDGTGKYKGISGKNKIRYKGFGFRLGEATSDSTPFSVEGYSLWEGEYRLP